LFLRKKIDFRFFFMLFVKFIFMQFRSENGQSKKAQKYHDGEEISDY
jgi:preprotein translocase subunit YajC